MAPAYYWDKPAECMDLHRLRELQSERLRSIVAYCYQRIPTYRQKLDAVGLRPEQVRGIQDLHRVPFTVKSDLRDTYPFGMFAVPMDEVVRIHASSGTTGRQIVVGYTAADIDTWQQVIARTLAAAGTTYRDLVQVSYGYGLFTGGLGLHYGAERIGATVIPTSGGQTKRQLQVLQDFGTSVLCCTPSYALVIGEVGREMGVDFAHLPLRVGCFGAEPWSESMRREIEQKLCIDACDIYGLSEIIGPGVSYECLEKAGLHINEDHFLPEIINPETGEPVPDGELGELVITTLTKEALPMLRYRTRDLTRLHPEPCACGRTFRRMVRITGRSDDMLIIRGVNVFPSQIESVLMQIDGTTENYLLVVDRQPSKMDELEVWVEVSQEVFSDEMKRLEMLTKKVIEEIESVLGLSVRVKLVEPKTIARSEGKAKRVVDRRELFKNE